MATTRSKGWQIELTHPTTGRTISPDVLDNPEFLPSLNSRVEARIPVRKSDGLGEWPDGIAVSLMLDGREQPLDEITEIEQQSDRTLLVAEGGIELDERVIKEYREERRHVAAEEIITNNTPYTADVDTPTFETLSGELLQEAQSDAEFDSLAADIDSQTPLETSAIVGYGIKTYQTAWVVEGEDAGTQAGESNVDFSGGESGISGSAVDDFSWNISPDYTIPAGELFIAIRGKRQFSDSKPVVYDIRIDDSTIASEVPIPAGGTDIVWQVFDSGGFLSPPVIPPGDYTITLDAQRELNGDAGDNAVDVVVAGDRRFYDLTTTPVFDNSVHQDNGYLDGPPTHPNAVSVTFEDATTAFVIDEATAAANFNAVTNGNALELSSDNGTSWTKATNTETLTVSNVESPTIRLRVTISNDSPSGAQSQTPRFGYASQDFLSFDITADIRLESLLIDESFDNDLESVLNDISGDEYIWSYRLDNGTPTIAWTQPGQRTSSEDPDIDADVSASKSTKTYDSVTVRGSAQSTSGEEFDASTTFVSLFRENIVPGSEAVIATDSGTQFERSADYEMSYRDGQIRIKEGGDMDSGTTYEIDYRYESEGTYPKATGTQLVETVAGVVSDRQAEQIAYVIHSVEPEVSEVGWTADVTLPRGDTLFDPLEALSLNALELPDEATPLAVREPPQKTPQGIALKLGGQNELESALRSISNQLQTVSRRS